MNDIGLLRRLCEFSALSGFEDQLITFLVGEMTRYADRVEVDGLGNVIAWLNASPADINLPDGGAQTAMLIAHMDEIGFVVRKVQDDGLLRLWRVGGIPEKVMAGQLVAVCPEGRDRLPGVIGGRSHHVIGDEEKYVVDKVVDVFVDVGLRNAAEVCAAGITVGTPVTWWPFYHVSSGRRVMSKALDNRLALYILLETLRAMSARRPATNLAFVATVHEEWSAWGSITGANSVRPDLAVVLDVAIASDMPGMDVLTEIKLDAGPVISTYMFHPRGPHMGTVPNPKLRRRLLRTAEEAGIACQLGTFYGGMTDSSTMQYSQQGVAVADVGIPARYTHYPVEVASLTDVEATARLVERFLTDLPAQLDLSRGS
ncbi:MAG: M42 family metallopeptidase [Chloroflexi bacterium]|nr:M42 family metallopeptidase [Chloroflexota bacterium]